MKIFRLSALLFILIFLLCSCKSNQVMNTQDENIRQNFLSTKQVIEYLIRDTGLKESNIQEKYLWVQYVNMDRDPELELLVSYRDQIHNGVFIIYDYQNGSFVKAFAKPWAIEKMSGREAVAASGDQNTHQLTAYILHLEAGKVFIVWSEIIDKYDYTNPVKGIEQHGNYYVDTNSILHYFYKIDKTNSEGKVLESKPYEKQYRWDAGKNKYVEYNE